MGAVERSVMGGLIKTWGSAVVDNVYLKYYSDLNNKAIFALTYGGDKILRETEDWENFVLLQEAIHEVVQDPELSVITLNLDPGHKIYTKENAPLKAVEYLVGLEDFVFSDWLFVTQPRIIGKLYFGYLADSQDSYRIACDKTSSLPVGVGIFPHGFRNKLWSHVRELLLEVSVARKG